MIDRRFLNFNLAIEGIVNSPLGTPILGTQYIVGNNPTGYFFNFPVGSIARYNGFSWEFIPPTLNMPEIFNISTGEFLRYNGSAWVSIASISGSSSGTSHKITEEHELTESEISDKSFTLENNIASGYENEVTLTFSSITFLAGVDFTASGNTISFSNNFLRNRLQAEDVVYIQYVRA